MHLLVLQSLGEFGLPPTSSREPLTSCLLHCLIASEEVTHRSSLAHTYTQGRDDALHLEVAARGGDAVSWTGETERYRQRLGEWEAGMGK